MAVDSGAKNELVETVLHDAYSKLWQCCGVVFRHGNDDQAMCECHVPVPPSLVPCRCHDMIRYGTNSMSQVHDCSSAVKLERHAHSPLLCKGLLQSWTLGIGHWTLDNIGLYLTTNSMIYHWLDWTRIESELPGTLRGTERQIEREREDYCWSACIFYPTAGGNHENAPCLQSLLPAAHLSSSSFKFQGMLVVDLTKPHARRTHIRNGSQFSEAVRRAMTLVFGENFTAMQNEEGTLVASSTLCRATYKLDISHMILRQQQWKSRRELGQTYAIQLRSLVVMLVSVAEFAV